MRNIKLLDCTLRDGGFVNDWNYGHTVIRDIISRLDLAEIDIIEIGYLNEKEESNKDRTIFPNTESAEKFFENISLKNAMAVAIIDYGNCSIDNIGPCKESTLNGIRVTFKKHEIDNAMEFCSHIKAKGYKVFAQPVSFTSYSDMEVLSLVEKVNKLKPYAISIVDTYGLMLKKDLIRSYYLLDHNLIDSIRIGYHSHNNYQLAFSNCAELVDSISVSRNIILDATLLGMGKSAGNAQIELIANYLNSEYLHNYNINQLLEIIDLYISPIYQQTPWGYRIEFFISASNDCHYQYVKDLIGKNTLSIKSINEIIAMIDDSDKLTYKNGLIEHLYLQYQQKQINDEYACNWLKSYIKGKRVLILAPGSTLTSHREAILQYIEKNSPIIFSTNFIPYDYAVDCLFVGNAKRYGKILDTYKKAFKQPIILATSNITESATPIDYVFNYSSLILDEIEILDNSTLMFLQLLVKIGVEEVALAGFDGFSISSKTLNYADKSMLVAASEEKMDVDNQLIKCKIQTLRNMLDLKFITPSRYE